MSWNVNAESVVLKTKLSCDVTFIKIQADPAFCFTLRVRFHLYFFNLFHALSFHVFPLWIDRINDGMWWCVCDCVCVVSVGWPLGVDPANFISNEFASHPCFLTFFHSLVNTCDGVRWMSLSMWPYQVNITKLQSMKIEEANRVNRGQTWRASTVSTYISLYRPPASHGKPSKASKYQSKYYIILYNYNVYIYNII